MNNRQLRSWVFMLYSDNPAHVKAIDYIDLLDNSLYIKHIQKTDEKGEILNKEHWHCVLRYESGFWLSSLLKQLDLPDSDAHLFHSFRDFKTSTGKQRFKTIEDYVLYLDHMDDDDKPDKYAAEDFHGGLKDWAIQVLGSRDLDPYLKFLDMCDFIRQYNLDHWAETRTFSFTDWFRICNDHGYGMLFYNQWYKMRDVLKPYIYY